MNGLSFYVMEQKTYSYKQIVDYKKDYNQFHKLYDSMEDETREQAFQDIKYIYQVQGEIEDCKNREDLNEIDKKYPEYQSVFAQYKDKIRISEQTLYYIKNMEEQLSYQATYDVFLNEMEQRKSNMLTFSIFGKEDSFSVHNIMKTTEDFSHLKGIELQYGASYGIEAITKFQIVDFCMILFLFLMCIVLFHREREKGLFLLVKTKEEGRGKTIVAKYIILFLAILIFGMLLYGTCLIQAGQWYGYGRLERPIQSISSFRNCRFFLTVKEYLGLYFLMKIGTFLWLGAIFSIIFLALKNITAIYAGCIGFLGVNVFGYVIISEMSIWNYFKCFNLFYFLNLHKMIGGYLNLNIFGKPMEKLTGYIGIVIIITMLAFLIGVFLFCKQIQMKKDGILSVVLGNIRSRFGKMKGNTSMLLQEAYKYFIQNKVIIPLLFLVLFSISSMLEKREPFYEKEKYAVYHSYMQTMEGEITADTLAYLKKERMASGDVGAIIENSKEELTAEKIQELTEEINKNIVFLEYKREGLELVTKQYSKLKPRIEKGEKVYFVNQYAYQDLFLNAKQDIWKLITAFLCLILMLSNLFPIDYKNGMIYLLQATQKGRKVLFVRKCILAVGTTFVVWGSVYIPDLVQFIKMYGIKAIGARVKDMPFATPYGNSTIEETIGMIMLLRLLCLFVAMMLIIAASVYLKNHILTLLGASGILLLPCFLIYKSHRLRLGAMLVKSANAIRNFSLCMLVLGILLVLLFIITLRNFVTTKR